MLPSTLTPEKLTKELSEKFKVVFHAKDDLDKLPRKKH
jgi:hypothetical protein